MWVDNAIDAFVLHIQGSGKIILPDGSYVRVGFDGRNGHKYTSIGRELVSAGKMRLKDVTMPSIRKWMEKNPVAARALMRKNKSFIFFKVSKEAGPIGAQGVILTPTRSIAIDREFFPMGLPVWLDTTVPGSRKKLQRLMITQDTGAAIKGPVRGDVFWGHGPQAAIHAGLMKEKGKLYLLLPRSAAKSQLKK
jgi:membrane-bound lytic murein transglycosylase A